MNRKKDPLYFSKWVIQFEERCKKRNVKFTRKNKDRLHETAYIPYCIKIMGMFNGTMFAIYAEKMKDLLPLENPLLKLVKKEDADIWHTPLPSLFKPGGQNE